MRRGPSRTTVVVAVAAAILSGASPLDAQPRGSERGSVRQVVNGTTLEVDYSRPTARGRDVFGGVVHWGELWTPGANWATTLTVDRDVTVDGHPVPAGSYSVWMRPSPETWTVSLHRDTRLYHDSPVPEDGTVLSFEVEPGTGAHMETLAWYFPEVSGRTARLRMHWGETYVPLTIEVPAYEEPSLRAAEHRGYLGAYAVSGTDPTIGSPLELTLRVVDMGGRIEGRWGSLPVSLVPAGEDTFYIGFRRDGTLFDLGTEMTVRMVMDGDTATGVEMLWEGTRVFARGDRITP